MVNHVFASALARPRVLDVWLVHASSQAVTSFITIMSAGSQHLEVEAIWMIVCARCLALGHSPCAAAQVRLAASPHLKWPEFGTAGVANDFVLDISEV